jgi:hypothetical protein
MYPRELALVCLGQYGPSFFGHGGAAVAASTDVRDAVSLRNEILGIQDSKRVFGMIGRLTAQKRPFDLIEDQLRRSSSGLIRMYHHPDPADAWFAEHKIFVVANYLRVVARNEWRAKIYRIMGIDDQILKFETIFGHHVEADRVEYLMSRSGPKCRALICPGLDPR